MIPPAPSLEIDTSDSDVTLGARDADEQTVALPRLMGPASLRRPSAFSRVTSGDDAETLQLRLEKKMAAFARKAPSATPAKPPPLPRRRTASASYPPVAVPVGPVVSAHALPASDRIAFLAPPPSRSKWVATAMVGAIVLLGAFGVSRLGAKPASPPVAAAEAPPAAVPVLPPSAADPTPASSVVQFSPGEGVTVKHAAASGRPAAPHAGSHHVAKAPVTVAAAPTTKEPARKKPTSAEQDLADAQLRAAAAGAL